tara:strand:- start:4250 stop:4744 length:495 start_codon:yes stop_codon:yes gene_type:complete
MTTTNEYYNVVINPGDVPVLGIDDTVQRPPPLPDIEPEPEPQPVNYFDMRDVEIRKIYKFTHALMFFGTLMYTLSSSIEDQQVIVDMMLSAVSYFSVLENNINILKMHTVYLAINFSFTTYYLHFDYLAYYFIYTILNICTIVHLIIDRRDYYINHLVAILSNP